MFTKLFQKAFIIFFLVSLVSVYAQNKEDSFQPLYVTITKLNGDLDFDYDQWNQVEQEFFNKVISKNEFIKSYDFLVNDSNPDAASIVLLKTFKSWDDIEKARKKTAELIESAWPDVDVRADFFEKQNKFFEYSFSNEVFVSTQLSKSVSKEAKRNEKSPLFFYVIKSKLSDYDADDSLEAYRKYVKDVVYKNPYYKGYLAQRHLVGTDSRDFYEFFIVNSYDELIKAFEKDKELLKGLYPDKEERDSFIETYNRGIDNNLEGNFFSNIPSISKF